MSIMRKLKAALAPSSLDQVVAVHEAVSQFHREQDAIRAALHEASESADALRPDIEAAQERKREIQDLHDRELKRTGDATAWQERLDAAKKQLLFMEEKRGLFLEEANRHQHALRSLHPPLLEVSAEALMAAQADLRTAQADVERINAALEKETARLPSFTVDDTEVVAARRSLEDALADAPDDQSTPAILEAEKRLAEAGNRWRLNDERVATNQSRTQAAIAGLKRKRDQLQAELERRAELERTARRVFLDGEIRKAHGRYAESVAKTLDCLNDLAALGQLAQVEVFNATPHSVQLPKDRSAAHDDRYRLPAIDPTRSIARFAALGLAVQ